MKKKSLIIVAVLSLVLLSGCGNKTADVSSNDVLIQFGNTKITKSELYYDMMEDDGGAAVINEATKYILDDEIETTDEITAQAEETYQEYLDYMDGDVQSLLDALGYDSEEELMDAIVHSVKADMLTDKYITDNWDSLLEEYKPMKAKMIYISVASDDTDTARAELEANAALEAIKNGATFESVAEQYTSDSTLTAETMYTTKSDIDYNVLQWMATVDGPTLSGAILSNNSDGYYIVQVTVNNSEQIKEEFTSSLTSDEDFVNSVDTYYFEKHGFMVYDVLTYQYLTDNYPSYLVQDEADID